MKLIVLMVLPQIQLSVSYSAKAPISELTTSEYLISVDPGVFDCVFYTCAPHYTTITY